MKYECNRCGMPHPGEGYCACDSASLLAERDDLRDKLQTAREALSTIVNHVGADKRPILVALAALDRMKP